MPSYSYCAPSLYRLPPTPPEDGHSSYTIANMSALQYQQNAYQAPMGVRRQDDRGFDYTERYGHIAPPHQQVHQQVSAPMMYPSHIYYNNAPPTMPPNAPMNGFYGPRPVILPPPRGYQQPHAALVNQPQTNGHVSRSHQERPAKDPKEDRPVGGVSAKLDYDMEDMTDFVSETAQAMYDLLYSGSICLADIDIAASVKPTRPTPPGFRKWVHQVLSATRLPSSTILLAFEYLSEHMRNMQTHPLTDGNEAELHRILTTSLILGSKFLDDNTFINRSWSEVSGIDVSTLNYLERSWLKEIFFRLHRDPSAPHGFQSFLARWRSFDQERKNSRNVRANPTNINTTVAVASPPHHVYSPAVPQVYAQRSPQEAFGPKPMQSAYPTPYNRYYPYGPRSTETSPPSAVHTSPTTPESYGAQWGSINGSFGFNRVPTTSYPQSAQSMHAIAPPQFAMAYPVSGHPSNNHGPDCFCMDCNRRFMMAPDFGVPVVG